LKLLGANTYTGGTTINSGTIIGNATSLQGTIANSATLQFDQTTVGAFNGTFAGGTVEKTGAGFLTITTANSAAAVDIQNGTLVVNGSIAGAGTTTVQAGASLKGTGTLTQDVTVFGSIKPGNSIGTINLIGTQVLASGSVTEIEIDATSSDLINITGALTIQPGATMHLLPDQDNYLDTVSYTIIQTTGGVTGEFSSVTTTYPLYALEINYSDPLEVVLNVSFIEFIDVFNQGNPAEVSTCLDELLFSGNQDLIAIINDLRFIPELSDIDSALNAMQPSAFTSLATSLQEVTLAWSDTLFHRMSGIDATEVPNCKKNSAAWLTPLGVSMNQSSLAEPGYKDNAVGGAMGIDFAFADKVNAGFAIGYSYSRLDWRTNRGAANETTWYGAFYAKKTFLQAFLEAALIGGYDRFNTDRAIIFQGLNRTAQGSHFGLQASGHAKAGLICGKKDLTWTPYGRVDYIYSYEKGFREYGADSIDLIVESKQSSLLALEAGMEFRGVHQTPKSQVTTLIGLSAIYEKRAIGEIEKASFVEGCQMIVKGLNPSRPLASATLGLNLASPQYCLDASVIYKGKFSQSFQSSALEAKITKKF
jgi:autotransporter-associated beta strand protein